MKVSRPYTRKDNRQHVIIYYDDRSRKTISYPRYLYEQSTNYILSDNEVIHHIDGDCTNNTLENLEVKNKFKHTSDHTKSRYTNQWYYFFCPTCGKWSRQPRRNVKIKQKQKGYTGPYCSRSCAGKVTGPLSHKKKKTET